MPIVTPKVSPVMIISAGGYLHLTIWRLIRENGRGGGNRNHSWRVSISHARLGTSHPGKIAEDAGEATSGAHFHADAPRLVDERKCPIQLGDRAPPTNFGDSSDH